MIGDSSITGQAGMNRLTEKVKEVKLNSSN